VKLIPKRHARNINCETPDMGSALPEAGQALNDYTVAIVGYVIEILAITQIKLRESRLAGPQNIPDPFAGDGYDWETDPDGRVW
jgi:hypothetical protein